MVSKVVSFREEEMYMQRKGSSDMSKETSTTRIEVEKPIAPAIEPNPQTNLEEEEEETEEQTENINTQPDLSQYSLARDIQRRVIFPPSR